MLVMVMVMVMPMMMMMAMVMVIDDDSTFLHFRAKHIFALPCLNGMKLKRLPQISNAYDGELSDGQKGLSPSRNIAIEQTPASKCTFASQVSKWGFDVALEMDMFIIEF